MTSLPTPWSSLSLGFHVSAPPTISCGRQHKNTLGGGGSPKFCIFNKLLGNAASPRIPLWAAGVPIVCSYSDWANVSSLSFLSDSSTPFCCCIATWLEQRNHYFLAVKAKWVIREEKTARTGQSPGRGVTTANRGIRLGQLSWWSSLAFFSAKN